MITHPSLVDLTGKRFGKLTVIKRAEDSLTKSGKKLVAWVCKCDCGKKCSVRSTNLKSGNTTSCGCIAKKLDVQNETRQTKMQKILLVSILVFLL